MPIDDDNEEVIKNALQSKTIKKDFNKWFNELFEKTKLEDDFSKSGYDDWLKSNEDVENYEGLSKDEQEKLRTELKETLAELTYAKLAESEAAKLENAEKTLTKIPNYIFVG